MGRFILKRKIYSNDKQSVWWSQAWDDEKSTIGNAKGDSKMMIDGKKGQYGVDKEVTKLWDKKITKEILDRKHSLTGKIGKLDKHGVHVGLRFSKWNPWNTDVSINNYFDAAKNNRAGRPGILTGDTRGKSAKEIYKDYLEMLKYKGVVDDSGYMSNKEMKDALRQLEKRRKILKGAYIGGGTAAVAGIGYGANKLYNKRKE